MSDRVAPSDPFCHEDADEDPLVDGRTARVFAIDWPQHPSTIGSALSLVIDTHYRFLGPDGPDLAAQEWLERTKNTWGLLSQWKLCDDCFAAGMGATCKNHLHQLSTAFPPFQDLKMDRDCDFCRLLRHIHQQFLREKLAQRHQRTPNSDNSHLDITWKLTSFMPSLRGPKSMAVGLIFAPPGLDMDGIYNPDDESRVVMETFSIYITFEEGDNPSSPPSPLPPLPGSPVLSACKPLKNAN